LAREIGVPEARLKQFAEKASNEREFLLSYVLTASYVKAAKRINIDAARVALRVMIQEVPSIPSEDVQALNYLLTQADAHGIEVPVAFAAHFAANSSLYVTNGYFVRTLLDEVCMGTLKAEHFIKAMDNVMKAIEEREAEATPSEADGKCGKDLP